MLKRRRLKVELESGGCSWVLLTERLISVYRRYIARMISCKGGYQELLKVRLAERASKRVL